MAFRPVRRRKRLVLAYLLLVTVILFLLPWGIHLIFKGGDIIIEGDVHKVRLLNHQTGEILELGLEEYVVGVVAAEMPASFPLEALKAQAIAARTYVVKRIQVPDPRVTGINPQAQISSDHTINQAWISTEEMEKRWGSWNFYNNKNKIVQAVQETKGTVLLYDGQLIDPAYHASCGGKGTENSGDVWKYQIPYLRRVECSNHPEANKEEVSVFSMKQLEELLDVKVSTLPAAKILGSGGGIQIKEKSSSGRLKVLSVAGKTFSGAEIRSKLGLKSTLLEFKTEGNSLVIASRGYGHGVGMCQYGAGAMAREGKKCSEILTHYYQGISFASLK